MDEGNDLERLIKLLKKTQGSNDHETLMAIRMTNTFLERKGWDWERLLHGKIRVVADPFSMVKPIPKKEEYQPVPQPQPRSTPRPTATRPSQATPTWPSSPNANRPNPFSAPPPRISPLRANKYPGHCWQCGYHVDRNAGHAFRSGMISTTNWEVLCVPCEAATLGATRQVSSVRAIRKNSPPPGTIPNVDQL